MHIQSVTNLNIHIPPGFSPDAMAAMEKRIAAWDRTPVQSPLEQNPTGRPAIGTYWPSQGGFYAGDMRGDDGVVYGLIVADCGDAQDAGLAKWGPEGEHNLSQWDGLANTRSLGSEYPAAKLAAGHAADEHQDFYLPARRELQLAAANVPHLFGTDDWYWSSTPRTESYAWAVDFAYGLTNNHPPVHRVPCSPRPQIHLLIHSVISPKQQQEQAMRTIPAINQPWPEQGGIYMGSRLIDGQVHHIVIPGGIEHDAEGVAFKDVAASIPAEINGHSDWRAPSQEDLMLAWINAREHFVQEGSDSIYWSGAAYNDTWAWAVDFEYGDTLSYYRDREFRVRPVRSFPDSSL